jgi:hypothetical protein
VGGHAEWEGQKVGNVWEQKVSNVWEFAGVKEGGRPRAMGGLWTGLADFDFFENTIVQFYD